MPRGFKPSVFVSSTCFDLGQVRADLKQFLESLGYDPILSDFNSFPIDPSHDTVKNCREAVKNRADILVLIVGGRYGAVIDSSKYVKNLEYIEAKVKGIPIYIFVAGKIINILPVWKRNKEADFSEVVDNNKLFEFVESLRDTRNNWVFAFESAQDICATLKLQLAYLFMDCLCLKLMFSEDILEDKELSEFSSKSLQILIDKPRGWEYLLFTELVQSYIEDFENIKRDLTYRVSFKKRIVLDNPATIAQWVSQHCNHISNTVETLAKLLNEGLPVAFGEPGQPGDAKHIHYIAKRFTEGYRKLIEWRLEFLNIDVDDHFAKLLDLASRLATNAIQEIEDFAKRSHKEIRHVFDNFDKYEEGTTIKLPLTITVSDTTELYEELEKVKRYHLGPQP